MSEPGDPRSAPHRRATMSDYSLSYPEGSLPLDVVPATQGPAGLDVGKLLTTTGAVTLDAGFKNTALLRIGDHLHRRRRGHPALPRLPDRAARRAARRSSRSPTCSSTASCRPPPSWPSSSARIRRHTLLHEDLKRFFDGFPRDAHPMAVLSSRGERAVDVLPGQPRPVRPGAGRDLDRTAAGQGADHRGLRVQEGDRPAVPLPGQLAAATSTTSCG